MPGSPKRKNKFSMTLKTLRHLTNSQGYWSLKTIVQV